MSLDEFDKFAYDLESFWTLNFYSLASLVAFHLFMPGYILSKLLKVSDFLLLFYSAHRSWNYLFISQIYGQCLLITKLIIKFHFNNFRYWSIWCLVFCARKPGDAWMHSCPTALQKLWDGPLAPLKQNEHCTPLSLLVNYQAMWNYDTKYNIWNPSIYSFHPLFLYPPPPFYVWCKFWTPPYKPFQKFEMFPLFQPFPYFVFEVIVVMASRKKL